MDKARLEKCKAQLEEMRQQYVNLTNTINQRGLKGELWDSVSELSSYDNHPADLGTEVFERSKDLALKDNALLQLQKIEDALEKIARGTYGTCDICGQKIPWERLEAAPESTLCLRCRQRWEGKGDRHPRPLEEDVVAPPFGGITHDQSPEALGDSEDEVMYDGEDAWQDVARYGTSDTPADVPNAKSYPDVYHDFDEDVGFTEDVDQIPYEIDDEGIIYEDY